MVTKTIPQPKNIGIKVVPPKDTCDDPKCPFHGSLSVRGKIFSGTVTSDKMHKTVKVEWERRVYVPKYERYRKEKSRVTAHNPPCISAKQGEEVKVMETRKLSKTKTFCVIEVKRA
ncbi:30S ribosomal protein S17 [archaeon CG10_big_fil_rev_8_21_14_0_10_43_11]|nr:MAG: 30S ribosomal protein S17 [archaeon CG10_big_fil_rev_8_21_14_0_10_43_11]